MLRQARRGTPRVLAHVAHQNSPTWPCHGVGTPMLAPGTLAQATWETHVQQEERIWSLSHVTQESDTLVFPQMHTTKA